jgi:hypothetical protein
MFDERLTVGEKIGNGYIGRVSIHDRTLYIVKMPDLYVQARYNCMANTIVPHSRLIS